MICPIQQSFNQYDAQVEKSDMLEHAIEERAEEIVEEFISVFGMELFDHMVSVDDEIFYKVAEKEITKIVSFL